MFACISEDKASFACLPNYDVIRRRTFCMRLETTRKLLVSTCVTRKSALICSGILSFSEDIPALVNLRMQMSPMTTLLSPVGWCVDFCAYYNRTETHTSALHAELLH